MLSWPILNEGEWNLISSNNISLTLFRLKSNYKVWFTYVLSGGTEPVDTEEMRNKSRILFELSNKEIISLEASSDWYIWIENADHEADDTNIENIIEISDGETALNRKGKIDVFINSQIDPVFQHFLLNEQKTDITLTNDVSIDDTVINVSSGHGFTAVAGEYITLYGNGRHLQQKVVSVSTNAITIEYPSSSIFSISDTVVVRGNNLLNVNGSGTPVQFKMQLRNYIYKIDISEIVLSANSGATASDDGTFLGLSALTYSTGIYFRKYDEFGNILNLGNYTKNQDFRTFGAYLEYPDKAPAGTYSTIVKYLIEDTFKKVFRFSNSCSFCGTVRANLSGLSSCTISMLGSYTDELI